MKYILKESELRSMLEGIIKEELDKTINEGIGTALWNTAKNAGLGVVAPALLAKKYALTMHHIINGNGSPLNNAWEVIKDYFRSNRTKKPKKETRRKRK